MHFQPKCYSYIRRAELLGRSTRVGPPRPRGLVGRPQVIGGCLGTGLNFKASTLEI